MLQSTTVFSNVSKGVLAKREDLLLVFGTDDQEQICLIILREGEFQVSDKERKVELDTLFRDVASIISEKCVNPDTNRPYTISMIERSLKDVHFAVDPKRPAKAQVLEVSVWDTCLFSCIGVGEAFGQALALARTERLELLECHALLYLPREGA